MEESNTHDQDKDTASKVLIPRRRWTERRERRRRETYRFDSSSMDGRCEVKEKTLMLAYEQNAYDGRGERTKSGAIGQLKLCLEPRVNCTEGSSTLLSRYTLLPLIHTRYRYFRNR